jgi:hypothetical protein
MFYPLKLYLYSPWVIVCTSLSLALDIFYTVWLLFKIGFSSEQFFLHYNVLSGVDWVGLAWFTYGLPLLGLLILLANSFLGWYLHKDHPHLGYIVNGVTLLIHGCIGIAVYVVIFLNV